ncbi:MAG: hypothetical protein ACLFRB_06655 [Thiohalorhabdus sp.]|uniref:hypothetical protein n=1 Tax=Thiohalorhabdus sp. TaxID=3094134 RepID=UPI00397FF5BD
MSERKGYHVRDEEGRYLGRVGLGLRRARPMVDSKDEAAVFPSRTEAVEYSRLYPGKMRVEEAT